MPVIFHPAVSCRALTATAQTRAEAYDPYDYITYTHHEAFIPVRSPHAYGAQHPDSQRNLCSERRSLYVPSGFVYTGVAALGYNH